MRANLTSRPSIMVFHRNENWSLPTIHNDAGLSRSAAQHCINTVQNHIRNLTCHATQQQLTPMCYRLDAQMNSNSEPGLKLTFKVCADPWINRLWHNVLENSVIIAHNSV